MIFGNFATLKYYPFRKWCLIRDSPIGLNSYVAWEYDFFRNIFLVFFFMFDESKNNGNEHFFQFNRKSLFNF
jgi:hypothetical protein